MLDKVRTQPAWLGWTASRTFTSLFTDAGLAVGATADKVGVRGRPAMAGDATGSGRPLVTARTSRSGTCAMASNTMAGEAGNNAAALPVRKIGIDDLKGALAEGVEDFRAKPSHLLFIGIIYPLAMLCLVAVTFGYNLLPLAFPLAAGLALLGPFAAIGLYELSRRREQGHEIVWGDALRVLRSPQRGTILKLGGILVLIFFAWMAAAQIIYNATLATPQPITLPRLIDGAFTTGAGWAMIIVGNIVGLGFALVALAISVVSFPLLVDRHVGAMTAVRTSLAAMRKNFVVMLVWGLIVVGSMVAGALVLLVGLAVVVPVLGHATWHLYRRVVPPAEPERGSVAA